MAPILSRGRWVNNFWGPDTWIFQEKLVNTMTADVLDPHVTRISAPMGDIMQGKGVLVCQFGEIIEDPNVYSVVPLSDGCFLKILTKDTP